MFLQQSGGCPPPSHRHGNTIKQIESIMYYSCLSSVRKMVSSSGERVVHHLPKGIAVADSRREQCSLAWSFAQFRIALAFHSTA